MKKINIVYIALFSLLIACSEAPTGNENKKYNYEQKLQELNETIFKLDSSLPQTPIVPLPPIDKIAGSRYIGMGEATHGTREFFQMKHRVFRYLVKKHGFRVFAIEAAMGESVYIDRYIRSGEGNLEKVMMNKMHFWTWKTEEVKALIQWIRDYNQKVPESKRLYYIGIDCQYMTYQPDLIENYFRNNKPGFVKEVNDVLSVIRSLENKNSSKLYESYKDMSLQHMNMISDTLNYLINKMKDFKNELIASSSPYDYKFTRRLIVNLRQTNKNIYYYQHNPQVGGDIRDKYMAKNALWISKLLDDKVKVAVWAHNGHIAMSNISEVYTPMGEHLKNILGNNYQTIGFGFSTGKFVAVGYNPSSDQYTGLQIHNITSPPANPSINGLFHQAKYDKFILNLDALSTKTSLNKWLSKEHRFLSIGAVFNRNPLDYYYEMILKTKFSVMVYFDETDYARSLYNLRNNLKQKSKFISPGLLE